MSLGRRLDDVLKNGRRNIHFRPIYDVFETKNKTFLRLICRVAKCKSRVLRRLRNHLSTEKASISSFLFPLVMLYTLVMRSTGLFSFAS